MDSLLSLDECNKILNKSLINHNKFKFVKKEITKFSETTLGFLAEHLLLRIFYVSDSDDVSEKTYFIKSLPINNKEQRDFIESCGVLVKEVTVYDNVIAKLQAISSRPFSPEIFLTRNDVMVFENLQARNFKVFSKTYLDKPKLQSALKTMAVMHGSSLALEELERSKSDTYCLVNECVEELNDYKLDFVKGNVRNNWYQSSVRCVGELCVHFTNNPEYKDKINDYLEYKMSKLDEIPSITRKVLCHDDLWLNNVMFNENLDCLFVDFQMAKYGPPAYDFLLLLYSNSEYTFLQKNLNDFIDFYYTNVAKELNRFNFDINTIMPKKTFTDSIENFTKPALYQVCVAGTYIFNTEEHLQNIMTNKDMYDEFNFGDRSKFVIEGMKMSNECETRLKNVILPLCDMFS